MVRVRHVITVYVNRKPFMASPMTLSHLILSDLERSISMSLTLWSLISCKGAELGHILLLNINRKAYMGNPMILSHLTLSGKSYTATLLCQMYGRDNSVYICTTSLWDTWNSLDTQGHLFNKTKTFWEKLNVVRSKANNASSLRTATTSLVQSHLWKHCLSS